MKQSKIMRFATETAVSPTLRAMTGTLADIQRQDEPESVYEHIPLERVEPDPENPRHLGITPEDLAWCCDPDQVRLAAELDDSQPRIQMLLSLKGLADSIASVGVLEPIKVYRRGDGFRLAYGERRYWGACIAGLSSIPALILTQRPVRLRALQLIENAQREDLDLSARVANLSAVLDELAQDGESTPARLAATVGMSERQARRSVQVCTGPADVIEAIRAGFLTDLKNAAALTSLADEQRHFVLAKLAAGSSLTRALEEWEQAQAVPLIARGRGRPKVKVAFGGTKNAVLAKTLMEILTGRRQPEILDLPEVDWEDYGEISRAWQDLLASIERAI